MVGNVPENKLGYLPAYLPDEAEDDTFCKALCREYEVDPDKGETVSIEDAAKLLGVTYTIEQNILTARVLNMGNRGDVCK